MLKMLQCKNSRPTITRTELSVFMIAHCRQVIKYKSHSETFITILAPPPDFLQERKLSTRHVLGRASKVSREDASHLKRWRRKARPKRPNFSTHMPYAAPAFADMGGNASLRYFLPGPVLRLRLGTVFAA